MMSTNQIKLPKYLPLTLEDVDMKYDKANFKKSARMNSVAICPWWCVFNTFINGLIFTMNINGRTRFN